MVELVDHVRLRRPEPARERDELRRRDVLRAQRQHLVVVERAFELPERGVIQVPRNVEPRHFDPETCRQRLHFQHRALLRVPVRTHAPFDGHAAPGAQ